MYVDLEQLREQAIAAVAIILMIAAFFFAGTLDHAEEIRHEAFMADMEARGELVLR